MSVVLTIALNEDWLEGYEVTITGMPDDLATLWASAMLKGLTDAGVPAKAVRTTTQTEDIVAWSPDPIEMSNAK